MKNANHILAGTLIWLCISSCGNGGLKPEELYGKWQVIEAENEKFAEEMWINQEFIGHIGFDAFVLIAPYQIAGDTIFIKMGMPYDSTMKEFIDTLVLSSMEGNEKNYAYKVQSSWIGEYYLKRISTEVPNIDDSPKFARTSSNEMMDRWVRN